MPVRVRNIKLYSRSQHKPEHLWTGTGGSAETMKLIEEEQKLRYNQLKLIACGAALWVEIHKIVNSYFIDWV